MTRQDLVDMDYEDLVVFENPDFDGCIIGVTTDEGHVVYSYYQMVEWLMDNENMTEEEANDFISYNSLRSLDYVDLDRKPIVIYDNWENIKKEAEDVGKN